MDLFVVVALAHFLALLIPGVDFFLIVRTGAAYGWRSASGACLGIALANGVFIASAFSGLALVDNQNVVAWIELAGGLFLVSMGIMFWRSRVSFAGEGAATAGRPTWAKNLGLGMASGLLNPKNALFYMSLAATLSSATSVQLALYGAWMFSAVLAWDLFIVIVMGSRRSRVILARAFPSITKVAGTVVLLFGIGALSVAVRTLVR
ncbi:LysE family translocator [Sanguibacter suarezii]|uniref:LysE family translocator n=1 Tax=Sanguibacter suarezii TaxID=60921 RepID=UPI00082E5F04|nr:LysE family transporter [Sanguibacter suarezii]